jgi:transcriptional regulator with XRE-family HTH domain
MSITNRIKNLINEKGLTPYHISHETGISEAAISRILNNKTGKPNHSTIKKFASFFGVCPDWIYTGKGDKYPAITGGYENRSDDNDNLCTTEKELLINSIHIIAKTAERNSLSLEKLVNYLTKGELDET